MFIPCLQNPLSNQGQSLTFSSGFTCKYWHSGLLHSPFFIKNEKKKIYRLEIIEI